MIALSAIMLLLLIVGLFSLKNQLPAIKGKMGEKIVAFRLSFLPKDEYIVLNDMMFKNGSRTTQIDHIIISVHGVFVVETKNYKGWIFGNSHKDYWTRLTHLK